jgi:hypothetical protein
MYNTNFLVKYHDIEEDLINNLNRLTSHKQETTTDNNNIVIVDNEFNSSKMETEENEENEEFEYDIDDVYLICEKLYRDELLSVFGIETIVDKNLDIEIKRVTEIMINHYKFKQLLETLNNELINFYNFTETSTQVSYVRANSENIILTTLFSQPLFYITHKCICQLLTVNDIDDHLISTLKEKILEFFKNN